MQRNPLTVLMTIVIAVVGAIVARAQGRGRPVDQKTVQRITLAMPDKPVVKPAKPRKVLVYGHCEGFYHGSIPTGAKAFEIMGKKTGAFEAVVSDNLANFEQAKLEQFDAVILNNCTGELFIPRRIRKVEGQEDPLQRGERLRRNLMGFIAGGKGVVGVHAATDCSYKWKEYGKMIGGYFSGHPWGAGTTVYIKIDDPRHPLTKMFQGKTFSVKEEIYQFNRGVYSRDKQRVLLSLDMTKTPRRGGRRDQDYAVTWVKPYGKGRVFYCSLGHNNHIFWDRNILMHYLAGIQFAIGDLKADMTPKPLPKSAGN
jgi:type 1 glutamine amidotransferase